MQTPRKMGDSRPMNIVKLRFGLILLLVALIIGLSTLRSHPRIIEELRVHPRVNGQRLLEHMTGMASIGKDPGGGYSRVAYTEADRQGREYVMGLMRAAGLAVSIDAAGNISGRRAGSDPKLAPLIIGSAVEAVSPRG